MSASLLARTPSACARWLRYALPAFVAALLFACGGDLREPEEGAGPARGASASPAEVQRRIAEIELPPAGELHFSDSPDALGVARRSPGSGVVYLLGTPLADHIAYAYAVLPGEVASAMSLDWQRPYDVVIHPADGSVETARGMLREHLESHFGFTTVVGRRKVEAMVIRQMPQFSPLPPSTAETSSFEAEAGELRAVGVPMSRLVEFLRESSMLPVVDESGLSERYDFVIQWDPKSGAYAFLQAVNDLGLEIVRRPRAVRVLELHPGSGLSGVPRAASGGGDEDTRAAARATGPGRGGEEQAVAR